MKKVLLLLIVCFCSFTEQLSSQSLNFEATGSIPDFISEDINGIDHELYADYLNNGQIVVALIDDHEATLKRFRKKTNSIALESANKAHETRIFNPERVKIQGILVSLYRNF